MSAKPYKLTVACNGLLSKGRGFYYPIPNPMCIVYGTDTAGRFESVLGKTEIIANNPNPRRHTDEFLGSVFIHLEDIVAGGGPVTKQLRGMEYPPRNDHGMIMIMAQDAEQEMLETFQALDMDKDGFIGVAEMKNAMGGVQNGMTGQEVDEMMAETGMDGDGKLSYGEMVHLMMDQA